MLLEIQPDTLRRSHDLTLPQLEKMVISSAKFTHLWANRRYRGWIFDVDMETMHVYRMGYYHTQNFRYSAKNT